MGELTVQRVCTFRRVHEAREVLESEKRIETPPRLSRCGVLRWYSLVEVIMIIPFTVNFLSECHRGMWYITDIQDARKHQ